MTRTARLERKVAVQSPDYYKRYRKQLVENGTVKKVHSNSTKENIFGIKTKWTKYCQHIGEDETEVLAQFQKEDIMTFLRWILDAYPRVRKRSSLHEYWRLWRMLYRKSIGQSLHAKVTEEINDYIDGYLTRKYQLDTTARPKPVMNVDDIFLILYHHWALDTSVFPDERQRLQIAFLLLFSAYTASRPGALVRSATDKRKQREHYVGWENDGSDDDLADADAEDVQTLCYEDIALFLLPNPGAQRDNLVMEVTLRYTKGWRRKPNPKTYVLTEVDNLIFDPVALMVATAILDGAFRYEYKSTADIFRTRVREPRRSIELEWKKEKLKLPIFRQAEMTPAGVRTSECKALRYHTYLYFLQRLGLAAGFMQILGAYMVRRGAGESVDAVATQAQLQQVMGHRDAGVYQAYINQRVQCDVQAAFLGRPSSTALVKAATHMSRYVDPRAPTELTTEQLDGLTAHPDVVQSRQLRDHLAKELRQQFGTLKQAAAEGSKIYQLYKNADNALRCAKVRLRNSAQKVARQQFFDSINEQEIRAQLDPSFLDLDGCSWQPQQVEHRLTERRLVADLLCGENTSQTDLVQIERRVKTIDALVALCRCREPPRKRKRDSMGGSFDEPKTISSFPTICERTQCLFCFSNQDQPRDIRLYRFATVYKARDHVERHLRVFKPGELIPCPTLDCREKGTVLAHRRDFMVHAIEEHYYDVFRRRDWSSMAN